MRKKIRIFYEPLELDIDIPDNTEEDEIDNEISWKIDELREELKYKVDYDYWEYIDEQ